MKVDQIAEKAVNKLKDMGLMYNGKPYLAREEMYRRAYTPDLPLSASYRGEESKSRPLSRQASYLDESSANANPNTAGTENTNDLFQSQSQNMSTVPTNKADVLLSGEQLGNTAADNHDNFGFFKQASAGIGFKMNEINFEESDLIAGFKPIYEISDRTLAKQSFRIENEEEDDIEYGKFDWNTGNLDDDDHSASSFHNKATGIHLSTAEISSDVHM